MTSDVRLCFRDETQVSADEVIEPTLASIPVGQPASAHSKN